MAHPVFRFKKEPIMRDRRNTFGVLGGIFLLAVPLLLIPTVFAQQAQTPEDMQAAIQRAEYQTKLQQVLDDKAGYAADIARRWEDSAKQLGRWDESFVADLSAALMKLPPDNLLVAGEASSLQEVMRVLATGRRAPTMQPDAQAAVGQSISPEALGSFGSDLVYTPVTPCRIVDTRNAGGVIAAGLTRTFDVDNTTSFAGQGGVATPCGIPYGVASAVAMTITVTQPSAWGWFTAWGLGTMPLSSVINYAANETLANTTIVPVVPGAGNDFSLYSSATAHAIIDVVGYYAAPVATALDCTTVSSAVTDVPNNAWTSVDANCPAGRTATGGGFNTPEGTLGYPGVWVTTLPNGNGWRSWVDNQAAGGGTRRIQTFVNCCRIPGR
jgi:hypothetical protein